MAEQENKKEKDLEKHFIKYTIRVQHFPDQSKILNAIQLNLDDLRFNVGTRIRDVCVRFNLKQIREFLSDVLATVLLAIYSFTRKCAYFNCSNVVSIVNKKYITIEKCGLAEILNKTFLPRSYKVTYLPHFRCVALNKISPTYVFGGINIIVLGSGQSLLSGRIGKIFTHIIDYIAN